MVAFNKQAHLQKAPITAHNLKWNKPSQYGFGTSDVPECPPENVTRLQHRLAIYLHRRGQAGHGCQRRRLGRTCAFADTVICLDVDDKGRRIFPLCSSCMFASEGPCGAEPVREESQGQMYIDYPSNPPITNNSVTSDGQPISALASGSANPQSLISQDFSSTPSTFVPTVHSQAAQAENNWHVDPNDLLNADPIDLMRQLDNIGWNGGEHFFGGDHDSFCFVCGSGLELFGCQTCETCYHASCMSPTLDNDDVPNFWFCPHCVERELHIPPDLSTLMPASTSQTGAELYPSPSSPSLGQGSTPSNQLVSTDKGSKKNSEAQKIDIRSSVQMVNDVSRGIKTSSTKPYKQQIQASAKTATSKPNESRSPPRKRSKYSAFSSEVDKALIVINKELEAAARKGKAEDALHQKIVSLEQDLKLKDGQIRLLNQELDAAKQNGSAKRLEDENLQLKETNATLQALVDKKDAELRDWRTKLKSMLGTDADE